MAGEWKQHEVWDGTYTFEDLLDWYEMAETKAENEKRYQGWMKLRKDADAL
jgi:hypothetical protein